MAARKRSTRMYMIAEPAQLAALASPIRQEIIDGVAAGEAQSVGELARLLGRSPHSLYPHMRALEKVGLVLRQGIRRAGRRDEALYAAPGRPVGIRYDLGSSVFVRNMKPIVASMLRLTQRDFHRRLNDPDATLTLPRVNFWAARIKARLTMSQLRQVNRLMRKLIRLLGNHPRQTQGDLHALTMVIVPLIDGSRKDRRAARKQHPRRRIPP